MKDEAFKGLKGSTEDISGFVSPNVRNSDNNNTNNKIYILIYY